jgi:EAL domain-containing protein (putative c-di-GMP-specific phosphodiesterase class I)
VRSIREVAHVLGKQTVAEWVESGPALALLRQMGVDFAQGEAVHVPCPLEQFIAAEDITQRITPSLDTCLEETEPYATEA